MAFSLSKEHRDLIYTRKLCEDRRGFFDHLYPKRFFKNAVRIAVMQSTTVFTTYYNDQLKEDIKREEKIQKGELSRNQADQEDEEWQEREWSQRLEGLSHRILVAFAKYHAIVLVMRVYENIAARSVEEKTLDKLTLDTFECSKREYKTHEGGELVGTMIPICCRANAISYLADYSVHQVILAFGYYVYIQEQRRRIKSGSGDEIHAGSVALSYLHKSALLAVSRGLSLGCSSLGGAIGSALWPGWGTLAGTNLGDSLAFNLTEEVNSPTL